MKPNKITLDQSLLHEMLDYQNGQLVWKNKKDNLAHLNGKVAGCMHKSGYRQIKFGQTLYPAHRIMWIYHNGSIDENMQIDHINGIKDDNHIENLRLVTAQQNCFNRSKFAAKGYCWSKAAQKWQANITVNGKNKYLGLFIKEEDARNAYLKNAQNLHPMQ
jgi:HNH endonuclease